MSVPLLWQRAYQISESALGAGTESKLWYKAFGLLKQRVGIWFVKDPFQVVQLPQKESVAHWRTGAGCPAGGKVLLSKLFRWP
jgi:hypothetical protein